MRANKNLLAADIVSRLPALVSDSPSNAETILLNLLAPVFEERAAAERHEQICPRCGLRHTNEPLIDGGF